ncbi:retropepsin-like aspartic protease family protein [Aurantiacibacter poecillastricola]|uniref:retropepsin-like aspartic protease family protein n=1 Tax=Aurantiacibacter poecillastricola TaxID=3064385 RepID=UPI00273F1378|nr:TIGR02281 family clan AA aspartic protease [Aurantiacibacter sp. 219JJ12-13]MDP5261079.1 TIGR02281 family clan AA aspartic protease [Aurantiacibacter sp. 219JJ12-13]
MDMRLPLTCVLITGAAFGMLLPVMEAEEHFTGGAGQDNAIPLSLNAAQQIDGAGWGGEVTLEREYDGHFYADVSVDGVPSRMLVDTGASVIALTGADAMAMGLYWDESDVTAVAQGASGAVYGVNTRLPRVRLGDFEATDVEAVIVPEGLGISLLGQSFLGTIDNVRIADDRMVLEN